MTITLPTWLVVNSTRKRRWLFRDCKVSVGPVRSRVYINKET